VPGLALGVFVLVVTGTACILADVLLGGSGVAGATASSTARNSAAVPRAIALADPSYAAIAGPATIQVAALVIVTAVLTPILTSFVFKRVQQRRAAEAKRDVTLDATASGGTAHARAR
jgi:2-keto-3-deoxygluconate permease